MMRQDQVRRNARTANVGAEMLEGRQLLNAHFGRPEVAHVHTMSIPAPTAVVGVLTGTSTYTATSPNERLGTDSYSLSGGSTAGMMTVTGGDSCASTVNTGVYHNAYYNGDWTMTTVTGATIDITYTGYGPSGKGSVGAFNEVLHGTATVTSGAFEGTSYKFDAVGVGTTSGGTNFIYKLS